MKAQRAQRAEAARSFKDYCLILQVHPEADAGMVEAAYWHLAKRYNDATQYDPTARAKLDGLNEAYSVLSSPSRREAYFIERNDVLGVDALPTLPPPPKDPVPLPVMEKQRPAPPGEPPPLRLEKRPALTYRQISVPSWQSAAAILAMAVLASAAFVSWAHPAVVAAALLAGIVAIAVPIVRGLPSLPSSLPTLKSHKRPSDAISRRIRALEDDTNGR